MSKKAIERKLAPVEAKAVINRLRISPRKLNLVAGLIRGMDVGTALTQLSLEPHSCCVRRRGPAHPTAKLSSAPVQPR